MSASLAIAGAGFETGSRLLEFVSILLAAVALGVALGRQPTRIARILDGPPTADLLPESSETGLNDLDQAGSVDG